MIVSIVVAVSENGVIGKNNKLLWRLHDDMKHFKQITMGHFVIMGRKTYDSIGKPLSGRTNIVISRNLNFQSEGIIIKNSFNDALNYAKSENQDEVFIIGGGEIYRQSLPIASKIYYTKVLKHFTGDVHFPELDQNSWRIKTKIEFLSDERNEYPFHIEELVRITK